MKILEAPIIVEYDQDTYIARCPFIQGAFADGDTPEEALKELIDVIKLIMEYRAEIGQSLDVTDMTVETTKVITSIPIGI
ncbi:MAG: type II toxin-antitoxin system HicB family antitoxin [Candidatus Magnetobacterium sp. LHC-1]|nr:type II toxin-antitoxin system HicB family antitoxin [Nitrospirota bacterium]